MKQHVTGNEALSREGDTETVVPPRSTETVASPEAQVAAAVAPSDASREQSESERNLIRASDSIVDPIPNIMFSDVMINALRAGVVLNFVTGLYLWLYVL